MPKTEQWWKKQEATAARFWEQIDQEWKDWWLAILESAGMKREDLKEV